MSADTEARRIVAEIFEEFRRMYPSARLSESERNYLAALILVHLREALISDEDDHR
jgi:hypothetical protein